MNERIFFADYENIQNIARALDSPLRRLMLELLAKQSLNINQLCEKLQIPQSTCATNIKILEKAKLIETMQVPAPVKGVQKVCSLCYSKVLLSILPDNKVKIGKKIVTEMPIGLFTNYSINAPCGIYTNRGLIGSYDSPACFLEPSRISAGLLWFSYGFLEYRFPKNFSDADRVKSFSFSAEVCSEYPQHNQNWPSDITLWINDVEVGTWTSPSDNGGTRGVLTPKWVDIDSTQFGFLKTWKITENGSTIDGEYLSDVSISDLDVYSHDSIRVKIGVKEDSIHRGGLNLFGSKFGNYAQDIIFKVSLA